VGSIAQAWVTKGTLLSGRRKVAKREKKAVSRGGIEAAWSIVAFWWFERKDIRTFKNLRGMGRGSQGVNGFFCWNAYKTPNPLEFT